MKQEKLDVFLLTKPPSSPRSELCLKLAARAGKARIYLAGDGVYHLLARIDEQPEFEIYACKEDLEARAIKAGKRVTVLDNFYSDFIEDIMEHCKHEYTF
ncbi:sulfurtransferase complex subunit TusB [Methanosarcina sp. UBA5]|uniref:sulfurtransferase complex subunit TusB n=1 Tax=Methanosarcina sp. UBA5 TaxID=1915593 RepID=UPI0025E41443|nr:sulfurtransferase complex subunit TusB [Methanosarcina sp. UBA5]